MGGENGSGGGRGGVAGGEGASGGNGGGDWHAPAPPMTCNEYASLRDFRSVVPLRHSYHSLGVYAFHATM